MASFLLVDEDRNFRESLAIALRLEGCLVATAEDADAARAALTSACRYDACVIDLHLAGAEALLAELVRGPHPVLVTGPHADLLARAAGRFPGAGVLEKPFRARDLLRRVAPPVAAAG